MTDREVDMMERYIYEVIRRVSQDQRKGIQMELTELITDMMEEGEIPIEEVLTKLGDPAEFAKQYRDEKNYLISPEYYDNYAWVMKIVLISVLASSVISSIVMVITKETAAYRLFYGVVENIIITGIGAFGLVTLIFAILERQKVKIELKKVKEWSVDSLAADRSYDKKGWTPKQLSPVPHKKALISRGESMAGIVFIVIFAVLLIFVPELFGAYVFDDGKLVKTIPIFNLHRWNMILPVWILGLSINFIDEMVRLVTGCYCKIVMISNIVSGVAAIILSVIILKVLPFFNADFPAEVRKEFGQFFKGGRGIGFHWDGGVSADIVLVIICVITLIEIGTTVYKTMRYGTDM